jgi:hypothetical protein
VTKVRLVWCGHVGAEQVVLTGVTSRDGTDFQMLTERLTNRASQDTTVQVWPVPPGRAADYPMARELLSDPLYVDQPSALAVIAPGAVTAELQQGDPTVLVGLRKLTGDGFAHIRLTPAELHQWRSDKPADLVVRDVHGQERDRVRVGVNDPWGEEIDGADATSDAPPTR